MRGIPWLAENRLVCQEGVSIYKKNLYRTDNKLRPHSKHQPYNVVYFTDSGPGGVVGIATGYGLDGLGIESR
jgi:hypothetical protein